MCCKGKPIPMTSGNPALDKYLTGKLGQNANMYPGPVSAQINPLMTNAANIMSMYGTDQPYQAPRYNTYQSFMPQPFTPPRGGGSGGPAGNFGGGAMPPQGQSGGPMGNFGGGANQQFDPMAFISQLLGGQGR